MCLEGAAETVWEEPMRVLVTVKAYPQPSRSYGETVCVAGVRIDTPTPSWTRLHPVACWKRPWGYLEALVGRSWRAS
ncbi:MAG: hypothetical protein M3Z25_21535 [Actinomycetota bacterium]|nr:hypothetical protein [Actinomycetota bacterium]